LRLLRCPENGRFAQKCTHERPSDLLQRVPTVARRWADLVLPVSIRWEALARGTKQYPYPYMSVAVLDVAVRLLMQTTERPLGSLGTRDQAISVSVHGVAVLDVAVRLLIRRWADLVLSVCWEAVARGTKQFPYPDMSVASVRWEAVARGTKQFSYPESGLLTLTSFQAASTADTDASYIAKYAVLVEIHSEVMQI
jgi:hypothetical protein